MRRAMHWVEARLEEARKQARKQAQSPANKRPASPTRAQSFKLFCCAGGRGARQALLTTVCPLGAVTALVWAAASSEWASGITDDSFLMLRAALLALFVW